MLELQNLSSGLVNASLLCLFAELWSFWVYGRHNISLEAYVMTREMNHWKIVWIWVAIDVLCLVLGDSVYEILGKVFIYFAYPLVMPYVIEVISRHD